MKIFKSAEVKGITILILVILGIGAALIIATGRLEQWFGFTWNPRALNRIIFVSAKSGSPQIYSMKTDGSDVKQLTKGIRVLSAPAISPLGNRIVFLGLVDKKSQVLQIGANGGAPEQLTASETPKSAVAYSPNGLHLSYLASGKVYTADSSGDNPGAVLPTEEEEHAAMANPLMRGEEPTYTNYAWGPDSVKMAGVTSTPDGGDLLVYLPEREGKVFRFTMFASPGAKVTGIAWARKTPLLAASIIIGANSVVVIYNAKEKKLNYAVFPAQLVGRPAVSPDGSEIVVPALPLKKNGAPGLVELSTGVNRRRVIAKGLFNNPVYSPKGGAILAISIKNSGKARDIVSIDAKTGDITQLTHGGAAMDAIWSPASE